jgi:hypothetical protein
MYREVKLHNHKKALILLALGALLLAGCAAGPNTAAQVASAHHAYRAGFWPGLWEGFIVPITFIISLFDKHVNIYEVNNDGNWYNFGFVLGAGILFGGSSTASSSRRK